VWPDSLDQGGSLENLDYQIVAEVISGFPYGARQQIMQRFADRFLAEEPRFDISRFARACGCQYVQVPGHRLRAGDEIYRSGRARSVEHEDDHLLVRIEGRQGIIYEIQPGERLTLYVGEE
jgi:hypothetical protein